MIFGTSVGDVLGAWLTEAVIHTAFGAHIANADSQPHRLARVAVRVFSVAERPLTPCSNIAPASRNQARGQSGGCVSLRTDQLPS